MLPSAALTLQSERYPSRWQGRVPAQVRLIRTVHSTLFLAFPDSELLIAHAGRHYPVYVKPHGAISAWIPTADGQLDRLGLKPDEFEITGWYASLLPSPGTTCPSGLRTLSCHTHHCPDCNVHLTSLYLCDRCNTRWYPKAGPGVV